MIVKAENYYPSCEGVCEGERLNRTKFWECDHVYLQTYHFESENDFAKAAEALQVPLEMFSRPLPGDETPFNAVEAEFHPYQGNPQRRLIRGAIIYIMNDAGKTIEVIRTDSRRLSEPQVEPQQVKYPGKKRKVVGVGAPTENNESSKTHRGKVPVAGRQKTERKGPYLVVHDDLGDRLPDDSRSILDRAYYTAVMIGLTQKDSHQRVAGPLYLNKSGLTDERVEIHPGQYLSILGGAPHYYVNWSQIRSWDNQSIIKTVKLASTSMIGLPEKPV
jgi:hypothetical protein